MNLGQDFPTPTPLFHDQKHAGKIPSTFDGIYNMIHPRAVTAPAGRRGARMGASLVGGHGIWLPREGTSWHRITCTIHHLLTGLFSLCPLVWKCNYKTFLWAVHWCANIALNDLSWKESSLFYTNCLACLLHRIMIQKEGDPSHACS